MDVAEWRLAWIRQRVGLVNWTGILQGAPVERGRHYAWNNGARGDCFRIVDFQQALSGVV